MQHSSGPIGPILDALRNALTPWLGAPRAESGPASHRLTYRFETTVKPEQRVRLKMEIQTREHFNVLGLRRWPFEVDSPWFSGAADVTGYEPEELLGTKLRALYQRSKGRDLFDLDLALRTLALDDAKIVDCFLQYLKQGGHSISRTAFEFNLQDKLASPGFLDDVLPLLPSGTTYDPNTAAASVLTRLVARL